MGKRLSLVLATPGGLQVATRAPIASLGHDGSSQAALGSAYATKRQQQGAGVRQSGRAGGEGDQRVLDRGSGAPAVHRLQPCFRRRHRRCRLPPLPPAAAQGCLPQTLQAAKEAQRVVRDAYAVFRSKAHDPAAAARSIDALQELVLQGGPGGAAACVALVKASGSGRPRPALLCLPLALRQLTSCFGCLVLTCAGVLPPCWAHVVHLAAWLPPLLAGLHAAGDSRSAAALA